MCQENGRRSMRPKRLSLMVLTSVSLPFVLYTRKVYWLMTLTRATHMMAAATIQMWVLKCAKPPSAFTRRITTGA